jgi:hypothetical protein
MQNRELDVSSEWLMKNAGPVIRYHTAVELLPEEGRAPALKKRPYDQPTCNAYSQNILGRPDVPSG